MKCRICPYYFFLALLLALGVFGSGILSFVHTRHSTISTCQTAEECFEEHLEDCMEDTVDFETTFFDLDWSIPLEYELFELPESSVSSSAQSLTYSSFGWVLPLRI